MNAAANALQSVLGDLPSQTQANANPSIDAEKFADPSGEKMQVSTCCLRLLREMLTCSSPAAFPLAHALQALVWHGKNDVRIDEVAKPRVVEPTDVLVKVTGSTVCGSGECCSQCSPSAILRLTPLRSCRSSSSSRRYHSAEEW